MFSLSDNLPRMAREDIAAEVRAWLGRRNRKQSNVAAELGWTDVYLSRRLTGVVAFSTDDLEALAGVLNVPADRFLVSPEAAATP
jgi:transcriptional regulator with XRE-family HTH domain